VGEGGVAVDCGDAEEAERWMVRSEEDGEGVLRNVSSDI